MNATSNLTLAPVIALLRRQARFVSSTTGWPRMALGLSIAVLAHGLATGTWTLLSLFQKPVASAAAPTTFAHPEEDIAPLLAAHLFGSAGELSRAADVTALPKSGLNLVLTGVLAGDGGVAFIGVDGRPAEAFSVGQDILPGVVLRTIYSDRVMIDRGGVNESLVMDGADARVVLPVSNGAIQQTGRNRFSVPRSAVKAEMNSASLLTQAKIVPSAQGGFVVNSVQPGSVLETLGLRAGQTIESVNGTPLRSTEDLLKLFSNFNNLSQIQIGVAQDGRRENLTYDLR